MHFLQRLFCKLFLHTLFRFSITGREHLNTLKPGVILAGNHAGFLDGLMLLAAYPHKVRFVIKEEVLSWRGAGKIVARINPIIIREGREILAIREALRTLAAGESICIFPEGKLSTDGQLAEFRNGVALLAKKSGAAIVPFTLNGSFRAWRWQQPRPRLFARLGLVFKPPIKPFASTNVTELLKAAILSGYAA